MTSFFKQIGTSAGHFFKSVHDFRFVKNVYFALSKNALPPIKKHETDAGYDLFLLDDVTLTAEPQTLFCGVQIVMPKNTFGLILPRSSSSYSGIQVATGVIDNGYRGQIAITAHSIKGERKLYAGDRIAQLVLIPMLRTQMEKVEKIDINSTDRGTKGFGSSGR